MAPAIDARIRDFLSTFPEIIRNTPASAFENFRSGAASDVAETDKVKWINSMTCGMKCLLRAHYLTLFLTLVLQSARERSARWWDELSTHRRSWRRPEELAAAVRAVTQAQVIAFSQLLASNASSVSSWIVPSSVDPGAALVRRGQRSV